MYSTQTQFDSVHKHVLSPSNGIGVMVSPEGARSMGPIPEL